MFGNQWWDKTASAASTLAQLKERYDVGKAWKSTAKRYWSRSLHRLLLFCLRDGDLGILLGEGEKALGLFSSVTSQGVQIIWAFCEGKPLCPRQRELRMNQE